MNKAYTLRQNHFLDINTSIKLSVGGIFVLMKPRLGTISELAKDWALDSLESLDSQIGDSVSEVLGILNDIW